ncbi:MAG: hypothetical protein ACXAD7_19945 [Candidatus Kariarchaeaceae archaeon]|jgi:hypothetical protein
MQIRAAHFSLDHGFIEFLQWSTLSWYPYGNATGISLYIAVPLTITIAGIRYNNLFGIPKKKNEHDLRLM